MSLKEVPLIDRLLAKFPPYDLKYGPDDQQKWMAAFEKIAEIVVRVLKENKP